MTVLDQNNKIVKYEEPGTGFWPINPITIWHQKLVGKKLQFGLTRVKHNIQNLLFVFGHTNFSGFVT